VAVLYADSAGLDSESINLEALETLTTVSGMAVALLSVSRAAPKKTMEEAAPPAHEPQRSYEQHSYEQPAYEPASEYVEPPPTPVEPAYSATDTYQSYEPEPARVEPEAFVEAVPVDEPADVYEETPAQAAGMVDEPASWSPAPVEATTAAPRRRYGQDSELPVDVSTEEERRLHNDARRFARLLISEIKLYNEQKVAEGRYEHDLDDRLREYIDRSREMYDKRVKAEVASRYDYFHGELVNTLAEGDVSKLGSNYPGATVNA
jgi:hypothetical protein